MVPSSISMGDKVIPQRNSSDGESAGSLRGCPSGCWSCDPFRKKAWRTTLGVSFYRRTSLPFRWTFRLVARLRSPGRFKQLDSDAYLAAHTTYHSRVRWWYGYHRVYDLVRNFHPTQDPSGLRVLSIGPRTEIELYYLWLFFGFSWRNIEGADLVSTSSKIRCADMSVNLPFEDDTFDVIIASHCLEKSRDPQRTRDEIKRVAKPGARVLVGGDRSEKTSKSFPIPIRYFQNGAHGLIDLYQLSLNDIEHMNARSPHGYEIIFRVSK